MKPLIIICGLSGTGKTFSSKILEKKLGSYVLINLGMLREQLGITTYSRKDTPKLLAMAIEQIEMNYHQGLSSILDANLKTNDLRQCFYDLAKHLGISVILIETICSDQAAVQRMAHRKQITTAENPTEKTVYFAQKKCWQDLSLDMNNNHVTFIRFDTEIKKANIIKQGNLDYEFTNQIIASLEQNN